MNEINNQLNQEQYKIKRLNNQKEELIFDIPEYLNEQTKKSIISFVALTAIFTTLSTVFGGWILMDYGKILIPSLLVGGSISGIGTVFNYISKTSGARNKLKNSDISKLNHDIIQCENNIKQLKQQLILEQSRELSKQNVNPTYHQQTNNYQEQYQNYGRSR